MWPCPSAVARSLPGNIDTDGTAWRAAGKRVAPVRATSRWFSLPTTNWGTLTQPELYGTQYSIMNCRAGQCPPVRLGGEKFAKFLLRYYPTGRSGEPTGPKACLFAW